MPGCIFLSLVFVWEDNVVSFFVAPVVVFLYAWPQYPSRQDTWGANTISAPNLQAVANASSVRMGV